MRTLVASLLALALTACGPLAFEPFGVPSATPDAGHTQVLPPAPDAGTPVSACENEDRDPGEADVDCGGDCPACGVGAHCGVAADCASDTCIQGHCRPASECAAPTDGEFCAQRQRVCGPLTVDDDGCGHRRVIADCGPCSNGRSCDPEQGVCVCHWQTSVVDASGVGAQSASLTRASDGTLHAIAVRRDAKSFTHAWRKTGTWRTEGVEIADATWRATHDWQPGAALVATQTGAGSDTLLLSAAAFYPSSSILRTWMLTSPTAGVWTAPKAEFQGPLAVNSGPVTAAAAHGGAAWVAYRTKDPSLPAGIRVQYVGSDQNIVTPFDVDSASPTALALDFGDVQLFDLVWTSEDGRLRAAHTWRNGLQIALAQETVVGTGDVGAAVGAAFDDTRWLHVVYYDKRVKDLRYVVRPPDSAWRESTPIDTDGDVGSALSLAVEPSGALHVAYADADGKRLKYAYRPAHADDWRVSVVDADGSVGRSPSVVATADAVDIVYLDATHDTLKHAHLCR